MILQNTEKQFMKESSMLAGYVTKDLQVKVMLQNTEGLLIKESNFLADNVAKNTLVRMIFQNTEGQFIKKWLKILYMQAEKI